MVLPGADFTPDIQKRFPSYKPACHSSVDPNGPAIFHRIHTKRPEPGKPQTTPIPGSERPGFSPVYRNVSSPDSLVTVVHPKLGTADEVFRAISAATPNNLALGERHFDQRQRPGAPSFSKLLPKLKSGLITWPRVSSTLLKSTAT